MALPLTTVNPNDQLFAFMHANRFRSPWIYSPSGAELSEPDIWNVILTDADIAGSRQRRNQGIVRPWRIMPSPHASSKHLKPEAADASKRLAAVLHEAFSHIDRFDAARFTLADAFFLGRRYAEIEYEEVTCSLDGTPATEWFLPIKLKDVDRRRFRWVPIWNAKNTKKTAVELHLFDTNDFAWKRLGSDERRRYVEYVWDDTEDRIGHGRGALECGFFTHWLKSNSTKKLMEGIDRLANGILYGKLDSLRAASPDMTNAELTSTTITMLERIRSNHVAAIGDGDVLKLLESTGAGQQIVMEAIRYFRESFDTFANGIPPSKAKNILDTGAAEKQKTDEQDTYYQFPRDDMDAVLQRDLVGSFLYFNEANLQKFGLGSDKAKRPKFTSAQIKKQDPAVAIEVLNAMLDHGQPVLRTEYYDAAEKTPPGPDDDVIEGANIGMAGMGIDGEDGFPKPKPPPKDPNKPRPSAKMEADDEPDYIARFNALERKLEGYFAPKAATPTENMTLNATFLSTPATNGAGAQPQIIPAPIVPITVEAARAVVVPAPQVAVNVPQQPPAVAHFTAGDTVVNVDNARSEAVLEKIGGMMDRFFSWFMGRKPPEKRVTFTEAGGKITGADIAPKE